MSNAHELRTKRTATENASEMRKRALWSTVNAHQMRSRARLRKLRKRSFLGADVQGWQHGC